MAIPTREFGSLAVDAGSPRSVVVRLPLDHYHPNRAGPLSPLYMKSHKLRLEFEQRLDRQLRVCATEGHSPHELIEDVREEFAQKTIRTLDSYSDELVVNRLCTQFLDHELLSFDLLLFEEILQGRLAFERHGEHGWRVSAGKLLGTSLAFVGGVGDAALSSLVNLAPKLYGDLELSLPVARENLRSTYRFLQMTEIWSS